MTYNKLVRDKVPETIMRRGGFPKTVLLDDTDYFEALNQKLTEEVDEYLENYNVEELADILEVIYALLKYKNICLEDFESMRLRKQKERGGFDKRILLVEVEDARN